jgi:xanthine dehydrogenase YagS FAD-binding subunit
MNRFEYAEPSSLKQASSLLAEDNGNEVLAGGTDLLSLMKDFVVEPPRLVSLQGVKGLRGIESSAKQVTIGAMTTLDDLLESSDLQKEFPGIVQAAAGVQSPQLRTMGTIGGELLQRPRCWYFRRGMGLLAQVNGTSAVEAGDHRYHAIFGNSGPAKFVQPSSLAPVLIALGAKARLQGSKGERTTQLNKLFRIPEKEGQREFTLQSGEILTHIEVPRNSLLSATYEVRPRHGLDWPLVTAAAALKIASGKIQEAHLVLGHVAPIPWEIESAAALLKGKAASDDKAIAATTQEASRQAAPLPNNAYKVQLAQVALDRAIRQAAQGS